MKCPSLKVKYSVRAGTGEQQGGSALTAAKRYLE